VNPPLPPEPDGAPLGVDPVPPARAPTARLSTDTITNFPTMRATRVSTRRRHQWEMAGQARLARASARNSTATYTAAARMSSSTHHQHGPDHHGQGSDEYHEGRRRRLAAGR
jgi:hypothetical protein